MKECKNSATSLHSFGAGLFLFVVFSPFSTVASGRAAKPPEIAVPPEIKCQRVLILKPIKKINLLKPQENAKKQKHERRSEGGGVEGILKKRKKEIDYKQGKLTQEEEVK